MKRTMDGAWKERLFPSGSGSSEAMAAGSLAAGVGLFVLSMLMVLAVGFVAGALVLIEKVAHNVMRKDDPKADETTMEMRGRILGEVELA
jgi:hypothetical protein